MPGRNELTRALSEVRLSGRRTLELDRRQTGAAPAGGSPVQGRYGHRAAGRGAGERLAAQWSRWKRWWIDEPQFERETTGGGAAARAAAAAAGPQVQPSDEAAQAVPEIDYSKAWDDNMLVHNRNYLECKKAARTIWSSFQKPYQTRATRH